VQSREEGCAPFSTAAGRALAAGAPRAGQRPTADSAQQHHANAHERPRLGNHGAALAGVYLIARPALAARFAAVRAGQCRLAKIIMDHARSAALKAKSEE